MTNKKHCDGERSVVVTFCTQAMFFFQRQKSERKQKKYMREVSFDLVELFISFLFIK